MTASETTPHGAQLTGSVPLSGPEEVFRTVAEVLGPHLKRLPDGETGERANWIGFQINYLQRAPQLELVPPDPGAYAPLIHFRLKPGASVQDVSFDDLGYASAARQSYAVFQRLQAAGTIPAGVRFQVSLPTPLAPVVAFLAPEVQAEIEPAYEARLLAEMEDICAAIPHDRLAIQWDTAVEFGILEGVFPSFLQRFDPADVEQQLVTRLIRVGEQVPTDVELGYHLCYGDAGHKHFKEPEDTSKLVSVANALAAGLRRPLNWLHLPVPRGRSDAAYFEPLRNLRLHPETELYLGLVHRTDGLAGTRRRLETARTVVQRFGVATECGLGRRPPETVREVLQLHADTLGVPMRA